jgi:Zn-dependent peptidase ImmA (M78 family)/DNA-binding XRE family transcriptional regulator
MFNPSRLRFARKRRGMTKTRLVEVSGVASRSLTGYESGALEPSEAAVRRLADALRFPPEFFQGPDLDEVVPETVSFRALSKMSVSARDQAIEASTLCIELAQSIGARFNLPPCDVPDLSEFKPEAAAQSLRALWHLGERPIGNMIHLLEAKGVRVFSLSEGVDEDIDALSLWKAGTPYVFLNTRKSGERGRFDAAHELAHLVLHAHGSPHGREAESEANQFASAFLMPAASVFASAPRPATIERLFAAKKIWNVSAAALAHRMHGLKLISDWQYRSICIDLAPYRREEPGALPRETSQLLDKVFAAVREDRNGKASMARDLGIYPEEIDALTFGLVMTAVRGGLAPDEASKAAADPHRLRLV